MFFKYLWDSALRWGLFLGMQAALFGSFVFPPPTASPKLFSQADGAGAGCATNAWEKLIVQGVVVNLVNGDVVPYIPPSPVGQGVEFDVAFGRFIGTVNLRYVSAIG
jgi:hypothetical protein